MLATRPSLPQEAADALSGSATAGVWWEQLWAEPALAQLLLLAIVALFMLLFWRAARSRAQLASRRRALRDYLVGVELLLAGQPGDAVKRLARVIRADPNNLDARLWHARALLEVGEVAAAHREHGNLLAGGGLGGTVGVELGLAAALLELDRAEDAVEYLRRALDAAPASPRGLAIARELQLRLAETATAATSSEPAAVLPLLGESSSPDIPQRTPVDQVMLPTTDGALLPLAAPHRDGGTSFALVSSPARLADALEANRSHVRRLLDQIAAAPSDHQLAARRELLDLGADAVVGEIAGRAVLELPSGAAIAETPWPALLAALGPDVVASLVSLRQREPRLAPGAVELVAAVGRELGAGARAPFSELLEGPDRDLRKVAIDHHLASGEVDSFDAVLDACSPLEVLGRFEAADQDVLARFLAHLPSGHVLLDVLLTDATFTRDRALLRAMTLTDRPEPLEALLLRRRPSGRAVRAIVAMLAEPRGAASALRLLDRLGEVGRDQLVAVYADLDEPTEVRAEARRRLCAGGPRVVARLCDGFGSAPGPADRDLLALLVDLGEAAVSPLVEAYRAGGVLERLKRTFRGRRTHRREVIIRALGHIGGQPGLAALDELGRRESDNDLKLRIRQAEHRARDAADQVGSDGGTVAHRPDEDGDGEVRDHAG